MEGMKYGFARVSTDDQNPALQLAALKKDGCKTIFKDDGLSGATTKRPALLRCLKKLETGDTLTVWKLDRLGRSLRDLITMLDDLKHRGVKFRSLTEAIDTETPTGRAMWQASRAGESHPRALPEPYVNLSAHTAPSVQPLSIQKRPVGKEIRRGPDHPCQPIPRNLRPLPQTLELAACPPNQKGIDPTERRIEF